MLVEVEHAPEMRWVGKSEEAESLPSWLSATITLRTVPVESRNFSGLGGEPGRGLAMATSLRDPAREHF